MPARISTIGRAVLTAATLTWAALTGVVSLHASPQEPSLANAVPANPTGEQLFRLACATCHGADGTGSPQHIVGFSRPLPNGHDLPDFTDCATNTVEPLADWIAVVHHGGPIRALDRHMPAFGDALSSDEIARVVTYLRSFCSNRGWPPGELNLPRAFFTEKAFPENESVLTTAVSTASAGQVTSALVYERRLGARNQWEIVVPFAVQQTEPHGPWIRGFGDVEVAFKRAIYHDTNRGSIIAAGGAVVLPSGDERMGLGSGATVVEPFAMWGQTIGANGFLQVHGGVEVPLERERAGVEGFLRTATGYTFAQDRGFGRAWSPMVEVLVAKPEDGAAEWDVVPQLQVSLSKLQHVLLSVGVRVPLNARDTRKPEVLTYVLWDWFDGGLFRFWK